MLLTVFLNFAAAGPCSKDYSPCSCSTNDNTISTGDNVVCDGVEISTIKVKFSCLNVAEIWSFKIRIQKQDQAIIPSNLLGPTKFHFLIFECANSLIKPKIDPKAFQYVGTGSVVEQAHIGGCDMIDQKDFKFLDGFAGKGLYMGNLLNLNGFQGDIFLPEVWEVIIHTSSGLKDFPIFPPNKLIYLTISNCQLPDLYMSKILKKVASFSGRFLQGLWLQGNRLANVPAETKQFLFLLEYSLSNNQIIVFSDQLQTYRPLIHLWMENMGLEDVDDFVFTSTKLGSATVFMGGNKLQQFRKDSFKELLDSMTKGGGVLRLQGSESIKLFFFAIV